VSVEPATSRLVVVKVVVVVVVVVVVDSVKKTLIYTQSLTQCVKR